MQRPMMHKGLAKISITLYAENETMYCGDFMYAFIVPSLLCNVVLGRREISLYIKTIDVETGDIELQTENEGIIPVNVTTQVTLKPRTITLVPVVIETYDTDFPSNAEFRNDPITEIDGVETRLPIYTTPFSMRLDAVNSKTHFTIEVFNPSNDKIYLQVNQQLGYMECLKRGLETHLINKQEEEFSFNPFRVATIVFDNDNKLEVIDADTKIVLHDPEEPSKIKDITINQSLNSEQQQQLIQILYGYKSVFEKGDDYPPLATGVEWTINTENNPPIKQSNYRYSPAMLDKIDDKVQSFLKHGIIEPSDSPWCNPIRPVLKPDGSLRFCLDLRRLNTVTKKDAYPLLRIDDILESLKDAKYFALIDLAAGYHQIPLAEQDRGKTAFATKKGLFHFKVLIEGATNGPAVFQRYMDKVLTKLNGKICWVYIDDILVFGNTWNDFCTNLSHVFDRLKQHNISAKAKKTRIGFEEIQVLGHLVGKGQVKPSPQKMKAIINYPAPKDKKEVQRFMGLTNYYRKFIKDYANIVHPIQKLVRKENDFKWDEKTQDAFKLLKEKLVNPPILKLPDFKKAFFIQTDASGVGIGAILQQEYEDGLHPVAFISKELVGAPKNYSPTEKECLAVVWAIRSFDIYLHNQQFILETDAKALSYLMSKNNPTKRLLKWAMMLSEYDFKIQYRKGTEMTHVDALSRAPIPFAELYKLVPKINNGPQDTNMLAILTNFTIRNPKRITKEEKTKAKLTTILKEKTYIKQLIPNIPEYKTLDDLDQHSLINLNKHIKQKLIIIHDEIKYWQQLSNKITNIINNKLIFNGDTLKQSRIIKAKIIASVSTRSQKQNASNNINNNNAQTNTESIPKEGEGNKQNNINQPLEKQAEIKEPELKEREIKEPEIIKEQEVDHSTEQIQEKVHEVEKTIIIETDTLIEDITRAQQEDNFLKMIIDYLKERILPVDKDLARKIHQESKWYLLQPITDRLYYFNERKAINKTTIALPRLVVPVHYRTTVIQHYHSTPFAGHLGINRTWEKLARRYYWNTMYQDIDRFIRACVQCQSRNNIRKKSKTVGTVPPADFPFQQLCVDYMGPIKGENNKYHYILIFIDYFSKYAITIPTNDTTAHTTAHHFINDIVCKYGAPQVLLSDRGANFLSNLMKEVYAWMGTKKLNTSSYHPQTNGLVERFNQTLENELSKLCDIRTKDWVDYLQPATFAYNTSFQQTIQESPYVIIYGHDPILPGDEHLSYGGMEFEFANQYVDTLHERFVFAWNFVKENLNKAQEKYLNKNLRVKTIKSFNVGDKVLLHTALAPTKDMVRKFLHPWTGPYEIVKKISPLTYEIKNLRFPAQPHKIAHIVRLKLWKTPIIKEQALNLPKPSDIMHDEDQQNEQDLVLDPSESIQHESQELRWEVDRILEHMVSGDHLEFLVKWKGNYENSWEPESNLKQSSDLINKYYEQHPDALQKSKELEIQSHPSRTYPAKYAKPKKIKLPKQKPKQLKSRKDKKKTK